MIESATIDHAIVAHADRSWPAPGGRAEPFDGEADDIATGASGRFDRAWSLILRACRRVVWSGRV